MRNYTCRKISECSHIVEQRCPPLKWPLKALKMSLNVIRKISSKLDDTYISLLKICFRGLEENVVIL